MCIIAKSVTSVILYSSAQTGVGWEKGESDDLVVSSAQFCFLTDKSEKLEYDTVLLPQ